MADDKAQELAGPDLKRGVEFRGLEDGAPLLGHFEGAPVVLVRQGEGVFAVGATCTHYGGPLAEGLVAGDAHPEDDEQIELRLVKLTDLLKAIQKGAILDGKTLAGVLFYARRLAEKRKR